MRSKFVIALIACLIVTAYAQEYGGGESQRPRWQVYALEGLAALGGGALCPAGVVGAAVTVQCCGAAQSFLMFLTIGGPLVFRDQWWGFSAAWIAANAVFPALAGYSTAKVGEQLGEDGSAGWAAGGAYIGTAVGAGIIALGAHVSKDDQGQRTDAVFVPACVLGGLCLPAGAVLGYNLGIPRESGPFQPGFGGRLQPPGVALTSVELPDHSVEYGVKVQVAGLKF
jgi:hypothetical protein